MLLQARCSRLPNGFGLSCTARAHVPKPTRNDACHVRAANSGARGWSSTPSIRSPCESHRARSACSSIAVSCFGSWGVGSRIASKLSTSRLKHGVLPTGEIDQHWLRQVRYSPCFPRSSITRVVIGTVRCHDYGRTFSGFGVSERRVQRDQRQRLGSWRGGVPPLILVC